MSAPKTNAQRQAALKARRKAAGLVPVTVWVYPISREAVKRFAEKTVSAGKKFNDRLEKSESRDHLRHGPDARAYGLDEKIPFGIFECLKNERIGS